MVLPFALRDYQQPCFEQSLEFAKSAQPTDRLLWASPTGTGKSYLLLALKLALRDWVIIVPNQSIMLGLLEKLQYPTERITSQAQLYALANEFGIYTPLIFRNELLAGKINPPAGLLVDEAHHDNESAETGKDIMAMCQCPAIGFTASPWQGTPQGTYDFLKRWGEPRWVITIKDAIARGFWHLPKCETWALVNDDEIEVQNGQLIASQVTSAYSDKIDDVLGRIVSDGNIVRPDGHFIQPTIITCGSTDIAKAVTERALQRGMRVACITQETKYAERKAMLEAIYTGVALVQIRTIGEGVDVHARVMIDLAPTLSPVLWIQRFGRLTRPGGRSRYICTNLNYTRFCYLLEGCAPELYLREAIAAFGGLSERVAGRAFGLQSLGRLKPVKVKTADGCEVHCYNINAMSDTLRQEYFVIVHPNIAKPLWFSKASNVEEGRLVWGSWERIAAPLELTGYRSANPKPLSLGQEDWWFGRGKHNGRGAAHHGLDETQKVTAKVFSILPILSRHKIKL